MTLKEMVRLWLKEHGYDGLQCDLGYELCGCGLDNLMPCCGARDGAPKDDAKPAYLVKCKCGNACYVLNKNEIIESCIQCE
jgi:hypothetical protein